MSATSQLKMWSLLPIACFLLMLVAFVMGINIVKIRQQIIVLGRELVHIEKQCTCLKNRHTELSSKIATLSATQTITALTPQNFHTPNNNQIVFTSKRDMNDFAQNGSRHFARKNTSTRIAMQVSRHKAE